MKLLKGLDVKVIDDERLKGSKQQIVASAENVKEIAARFKENSYFLEDIMAMEFKESFHLIYRFNHFKNCGVITVRISINKEPAEIETISDIYQGALWHEREVFEFYGITFKNHPDLKPLLLPAEDFEGYPLRKSEKTIKSIKDIFPMLFNETDEEEEQS